MIGHAVGNWAIVHGFALLLIDGRLDMALTLPDRGGDVDVLLDAALAGFGLIRFNSPTLAAFGPMS
jgi:hypothetical protein